MFGNKLENGELILSDGMREEFDIAVAKGVFVIPVGITGSMSKLLWNEVMKSYQESQHENGKKITPLLGELGDKSTSLERAQEVILLLLRLI